MSDLINRLQNIANNKTTDLNNFPKILLQTRELYDDFVFQMQKSDFYNSPRRYIIERSYIKQLVNLAEKYKISQESEKWNLKLSEIEQKLADFGIKIND